MQNKMQIWYNDKEKRREAMRTAAANGANRKMRRKVLAQLKQAERRGKGKTNFTSQEWDADNKKDLAA